MGLVGYTRGPDGQDEEGQLLRFGCVPVFWDALGPATLQPSDHLARKVLPSLMEGDTLVVACFAALGLPLGALVELARGLRAREVGLVSLDPGEQQIDLRALDFIQGTWLAERANDRARVAALAGRSGGRPRVMTEDKVREANRMAADGATVDQIARAVNASRASVYRALPGLAELRPGRVDAARPSPTP